MRTRRSLQDAQTGNGGNTGAGNGNQNRGNSGNGTAPTSGQAVPTRQNRPTERDPLKKVFENGNSNAPIVGVAPKARGQSVRSLYGLKYYEEWVFIFVPTPQLLQQLQQQQQNQGNQQGRPTRPRVSP